MAKYKIIFDREVCIGALACNSVAPGFWKLAKDGRVDLEKAKYNKKTDKFELIIDEKWLLENEDAAKVCPVTAIRLEKIEEKKEGKN